jgi:hypothetical protein
VPRARFLRPLSAALVGALLGAGVTQAAQHRQLAALVEAGRLCRVNEARLHVETGRLREELARVTASRNIGRVIREVDIRRVGPGPELPDIRQALEPLTATLIGVNPDAVSFDLAWNLFDNRVVDIQGRLWRVRLRGILLGSATLVVLSLRPVT